MEYIIPNVPYIAQTTDATCWNAAYKMLLRFKNKEESVADALPNDSLMRDRGILDPEFPGCRSKVGLTSSTYKAFLTADDIAEKLKFYGPIWVSGEYCESKYKHIIVLRGVKDPVVGDAEVYINDPWSGYKYGLNKPRWIPLERFTSKINKVSFSCQHWF